MIFSTLSISLAWSVLNGWKASGLIKISKTALYKDLRRLVDRCQAVFGCLDTSYDLDGIVLDYVIYRYFCFRKVLRIFLACWSSHSVENSLGGCGWVDSFFVEGESVKHSLYAVY